MMFFGILKASFSTRLLAVFLALVCVVLSGCGASEAELSGDSSGTSASEVELDDGNTNDELNEEPESERTLRVLSNPQGSTLVSGQSHTFEVQVEHSHPVSVSWMLDGNVVQVSSSKSFSTSIQGEYSCSVTDGVLTVSCTSFELAVEDVQFVSIVAQPSNQMVTEGEGIVLSLQAVGSGGLSYQWYFNGELIDGAVSSEFAITSTSLEQEGSYYCVVSSGGASETSNTASIVVNEAADIAVDTLCM